MYSPSFKLVFNYVWNGIPAWYKCLEKMRCKFRFAFYSGFLFILIKVTYYIWFTLFFLLLYLSICKLCNIRCRHYRYHCTGFLMKMHARAHRVMSVCTQLHIPSYTRSEAECLRKDQLLCNSFWFEIFISIFLMNGVGQPLHPKSKIRVTWVELGVLGPINYIFHVKASKSNQLKLRPSSAVQFECFFSCMEP